MKLLGSKRIRTTACYPESNGLIKRFHRNLKSVLRAMLNQSNWLENLPLEHLGLRTTIKESTQCSSAEVIYGTTVRLPGQFFFKSPQTPLDITSFVDCLTAKMANLAFNHPAQCKKATYISKLFETCTHVFIRDFAGTHSLQPPSRGPFKILKRNKIFLPYPLRTVPRTFPWIS